MKVVGVMDKSLSFGGEGGAVFHEVRHALYDAEPRPQIVNYIYGLGGRDSSPRELRRVYEELLAILRIGRARHIVNYLGLRE
jgi:pyruvate ferredoxin oxidoreductase alpha subunit